MHLGGGPIVLERIQEVVKKHPNLAAIAGAVSHQILTNIARHSGGGAPNHDVTGDQWMYSNKKSASGGSLPLTGAHWMYANPSVSQIPSAKTLGWRPSGGEDQFHIGDQRKHYLDIALLRR